MARHFSIAPASLTTKPPAPLARPILHAGRYSSHFDPLRHPDRNGSKPRCWLTFEIFPFSGDGDQKPFVQHCAVGAAGQLLLRRQLIAQFNQG
jgi:hypothetical protein